MLGMSLLRFLALAGAALVVWLAIVVVVLVATFGIAFAADMVQLGDDASPILLFGVTMLALCLSFVAVLALVVPLIYLYVRWFVATPAIVDQRVGPVTALRTSWRLTKGNALRISGYGLLLFTLSFVVVSLPVSLLQWLAIVVAGSGGSVAITTALTIAASALLSVLWQPLFAIAVVLLYFDLRVRRESYDLTLRLAELEAELAQGQPPAEAGAASV
jgi:hypothetical protein